ncbi:MAG: hypothetical protein NVS3B12_28610 [Acidimicrobiales bacterium]
MSGSADADVAHGEERRSERSQDERNCDERNRASHKHPEAASARLTPYVDPALADTRVDALPGAGRSTGGRLDLPGRRCLAGRSGVGGLARRPTPG